jgi:hypothetical protein
MSLYRSMKFDLFMNIWIHSILTYCLSARYFNIFLTSAPKSHKSFLHLRLYIKYVVCNTHFLKYEFNILDVFFSVSFFEYFNDTLPRLLLEVISVTILFEEYRLLSFSLCNFPYHPFTLGPDIIINSKKDVINYLPAEFTSLRVSEPWKWIVN